MLSPIYVHRIEIIALTEPGMDMSVGSINLRNKIVILPAKQVYSGIVAELQIETCKLWQTMGKRTKEKSITL